MSDYFLDLTLVFGFSTPPPKSLFLAEIEPGEGFSE
jgi:hypothetical protein